MVDDHRATLDRDNPRDLIDAYLIEMEKDNPDSTCSGKWRPAVQSPPQHWHFTFTHSNEGHIDNRGVHLLTLFTLHPYL